MWRRGVEENVLQSLENLITYDVVRSALESGAVRLHAWIYDIYDTRISALDPASGRFLELHPDGNSLDFMRGLIVRKTL